MNAQFLAVAQAVLANRLAKRGSEGAASTIDRVMRWSYVGVFAVLTYLYI